MSPLTLKWLSCLALVVVFREAAAATGTTVITGISPTSITAGSATSITLKGTVAAGDKVIWALDCSAATPSEDPNDGVDAASPFTVAAAGGPYKLCYRASGSSDSVEQAGITLTVKAAPSPQQIPNDIMTIMARFDAIQKEIVKLQTKALDVGKVVQQVEALGKQTLTRVTVAETDLIKISKATAGNPLMITGLKNQTKQAGLKIKVVLKEMKGLMKVVDSLEGSSMKKSAVADQVIKASEEMKSQVKRLFPDAGLKARIIKDEATIQKYQAEVGTGLGSIVEKSLRGHFKSATDSLDKLMKPVLEEQ